MSAMRRRWRRRGRRRPSCRVGSMPDEYRAYCRKPFDSVPKALDEQRSIPSLQICLDGVCKLPVRTVYCHMKKLHCPDKEAASTLHVDTSSASMRVSVYGGSINHHTGF
jgi:hypothetical protein